MPKASPKSAYGRASERAEAIMASDPSLEDAMVQRLMGTSDADEKGLPWPPMDDAVRRKLEPLRLAHKDILGILEARTRHWTRILGLPLAEPDNPLDDTPETALTDYLIAVHEMIPSELPRSADSLNALLKAVTSPKAEWSVPLTKAEISRRYFGEFTQRGKPMRSRKLDTDLTKWQCEPVTPRTFRVRLDLMDPATRRKIEAPNRKIEAAK